MKKILLPFLIVFFGLFLIYPLSILLSGAFFIESEGTRTFSLQYFQVIFENPFYRECFGNSFMIAVLTTISCLLASVPLAYLFLRIQFPGKLVLSTLLLVPLILPPFVGAIGLKQFFARFGSLNLLLSEFGLVNLQDPPDWFGSGGFIGIILLQVLHLYPIMYLSVQAALANLDPSLRDAARNLGANGWRIFRTVTFPLALPGIFAGSSIVFVAAFTDLGVPLMFDFQTTVPSQIFNLVTQSDNPLGYALVVLTLVVVSVLFIVGKKFGEGNYAMMGRTASYDDVTKLVGWKGYAVTAGILSLIAVSLLPHLGVIIQSFSAKWFMSVLPNEWSTEYYKEVFTHPDTLRSMKNSLVYATSSALFDLVLGLGIAYLLARETFKGKNVLDVVSMIPLALPGLVLAFALYVAYSRPVFPSDWTHLSLVPFDSLKPLTLSLFPDSWMTSNWLISTTNTCFAIMDPRKNPTWLLVIAYSIHRLPYIVRSAYAGFQQTSVSLEEASLNMGCTPFKTLLKISLPLISANLIAGTILTFSFAMLDVSNGMILAQEGSFYPVTKAIYALMGRITPTAPSIACALGVLAMGFLALSLYGASKLLGNKMGQLFKA